ncbi:hypothetical protein [Pandoraea pnomenusa]|uniref:hypothetical protein n=1 Tax=Pandoraea pnomenusa TaxID=93220 RepID=UPI00333EE106
MCGTNNAPRAQHCEKCGAKLADAEPGFRADALVPGAAGALAVTSAMEGREDVMPVARSDAGDAPPSRRTRRQRGEAPGWLNGALVVGTAVFAAIALVGIWWNLRAPYVDPVPKAPGGLAVAPFNNGNNAPPAVAPGTPNDAAASAPSEASAALARAQALAAVDAAASGAAADVAEASRSVAPLTASAATAALTAAATAITPPSAPNANAPDDMMQLLSRRAATNADTGRGPAANADLPAHYDTNDIGAVAAERSPNAAPVTQPGVPASAPTAAGTIAAALAQCERYRWYEVIPKQRCIWAVCNGRWGKDGCPAGTNPGESR